MMLSYKIDAAVSYEAHHSTGQGKLIVRESVVIKTNSVLFTVYEADITSV